VLETLSVFMGGVALTLIKYDLIEALKELLESSQSMTNGNLPSANDLERYYRAVEWSQRVIAFAER
jgi:hypothetical protein